MRIARIAVALTLVVGLSTPALAGDLAASIAKAAQQRQENLRQLCRSARIDLVEVSTDGTHLDALVRFFQLREHRLQRT